MCSDEIFYKKPAPLSRIMRIEKTNRIRMIIFCDVKLHIKRKGHRYPNFKKQRSNARAHKEILLTAPSNTNPEPSLLLLPAQGTTTSHLLVPQPVLWSPISTDGLCLHSTQISSVFQMSFSLTRLTFSAIALSFGHSPLATHVCFPYRSLHIVGLLPQSLVLAFSLLFPKLCTAHSSSSSQWCCPPCQPPSPALFSSRALSTLMYYTIHLFIMCTVCLLHLECEFLQDRGFSPLFFSLMHSPCLQ